MIRSRIFALAATVSMIAAAFGAAPALAQDEQPQPPTATPNPVAFETPAGDGTAVRLTTDMGDIVVGLYNESAPVASENFQNLVESGYYDGIGFHRIVRNFVIQGGDPSGNGSGGPGYTIPDEEVVGQYGRGIVAMARTQAPDSQGSQFFVVLDDAARPALESANTYVIFGRVLEGMDVVDAIAARGPEADVVDDQVLIQAATIEQVELPPEPTPQPPSALELAGAELIANIPTEVGGLVLDSQIIPVDQFLAGATTDEAFLELTDIAAENGSEVADMAMAISGGDDGDVFVTALGASMAGVPGDTIKEPMIELVVGEIEGSETSQTTVAGREVTSIKPTPDSGPRDTIYVVTSGDSVWFVLGDDASVAEVIESLG